MNEEYLWDKTGSDPEIEKLEAKLKEFAYKGYEPPPIPAKAFTLADVRPRRFFRFHLAFASAALAALTVSIIGFFIVQQRLEKIDQTLVAAPEISTLPATAESVTEPLTRPAYVPTAVAGNKLPEAHRAVYSSKRASKPVPRKPTLDDPQVEMTKEEAYAYNQLMLALSITSSKLRLVKDKVDGVENPKTEFENVRVSRETKKFKS
jgi:hypothetical protein